MKKIYISILLSLLLVGNLKAQYFKENNYYDLSLSTKGNQSLASISWNHLHGMGKSKKFSLGYGLRYNANFGKDADFITAPAKLTSGSSGLGVLFSENKLGNFDTVFIPKYMVHSINASIYLNYQFNQKWGMAFNIDAVGFSFGLNQVSQYNSSKKTQSPNQAIEQSASPTKTNLLLVSDNDYGSLNSEIYVIYWFKPKWALKGGASFSFTEYTTVNKLYLDNDRFRNKSLQGMIGISYSPFRN
ncbi:MAG: hypothetical protein SGJ00_07475 [bacterium]|nr:hypothetical protein [bacterium]